MRTVGLVGGMGPDAGVDLARRFVDACTRWQRQRFGAASDQGFVPHVLVQLPIPARVAALEGKGADPLPGMVDALRRAAAAGAQLVGIACNTAHHWLPQLRAAAPAIEIVDIAEVAAAEAAARGWRKVAVMCTPAAERIGLYARALGAEGLEPVALDDDDRLALAEGIFDGVKAGVPALGRERFERTGRRLLARSDGVLFACTEIGVVLAPSDLDAERAIDAAEALATELARRAYEG